jgi:uncharacterized protein (TIGR02217 family)
MSFAEVRLENGIVTRGMTGGPKFSTSVVTVNSGFEQRNKNWSQARGAWQLGNRLVREAELQVLISFFRARNGKWQGFRLKDWGDYKDAGIGILGTGVALANTSIYQMNKRYTSGSDYYDRNIIKPVAGSVVVKVNGTPAVAGGSFGNYALNTATGVVTFIDKTSGVISGITQAVSAVVTVANTFVNGDLVYFASVPGMTQINGLAGTVSAASSIQFTVNIDTTGFTPYAGSAGVATKRALTPGDVITWTGEFDVPVRFDTDDFTYQLEEVNYNNAGVVSEVFAQLGNIPVVEIRV